MAPISREETDFGPGGYGASDPNVPGTPTFYSNAYYRITSSNDVLVLTSDEGGPVSIDVPDGAYTEDGLATALQTAMNASTALTGTGTITFAVTYDATTNKFTIDAGTGHTISYTHTGSDAGSTFGFREDHAAAQTITSDIETHGSGTVTFDFTANSNDATVTYAVYSNVQTKYVGADGLADEASEVWQTLAQWASGGVSGRVTVLGLSDYTDYTFKVKARNEDESAESAFSADSAAMNTQPLIDYGTQSASLARKVTTGDTLVDATAGVVITGGFGAIGATFTLTNNYETASRVLLEYSEDGSTWVTATDFFTIGSGNNVIRFTSDQGTANITITSAAYDDGDALATALESAMNADTTLTGTGAITFVVTYSAVTGKYTIDAGVGHTITLDFWTTTTGAFTFGFNDSPAAAARTITSDESRGESPRVLATDAAGVEHTIYWDSYTDAGNSEYDTTVYLRATPYDASPSGGDAGKTETSAAFSLDNRPTQVVALNADGFTYDKDTTPVFQAVMGDIRGGTRLFFRVKVSDGTGTLVLEKDSASVPTGWEYETAPDTWVSCTAAGVSPLYADGVNRIRYTVQAGDALTADNDNNHTVTIEQGEVRDRG